MSDKLKKEYEEFLNRWENITGPKGFDCYEAGYYHGIRKYKKLVEGLKNIKTYELDSFQTVVDVGREMYTIYSKECLGYPEIYSKDDIQKLLQEVEE